MGIGNCQLKESKLSRNDQCFGGKKNKNFEKSHELNLMAQSSSTLKGTKNWYIIFSTFLID
ncbi:MAG: hypothetical protein DRR19_09790 [Candidatus Parabeggiatoa sp. nov. 1]|nr:MAG: hypothetical protein DRR19_09790 [Gammaproteobacteria bacterium]